MKGCFWAVVAIAVIGVGGAVVLLGGGGPTQCPTVPENGSWSMGAALQSEIKSEIRGLLNDPGSMDYHGATANPINSATRADGSRYFTRVVAQFTAKNAFGGRVSGAAEINLDENAEGACVIRGVELF